ncbi:MAG TPA: ribbon-helix-helix protein, CopG family [Terrimesophilobacter sp.]|nr:ribbon-helix-helix protein, CopG family [Terrimesophilobacter sp.]
MAMTVRLSTELDEQLQRIADARHTSKHALVLQAVEVLVKTASKTDLVMESVERTLERDAELLNRLEDA